uniref:BTB domain-containing protein n=1 Tax=Anopheles atroparvus TaxID=41427 RepID=A0A182JBR2_ANOAO
LDSIHKKKIHQNEAGCNIFGVAQGTKQPSLDLVFRLSRKRTANCDTSERSKSPSSETGQHTQGETTMSNLYAKISQRPMKRNEEQIFSVFPYHNIEMFNVLAPFHQNSAGAGGAAGVAAATAAGSQNVRLENMQVTQPCSAPSSPTIASPGALSSTSFCLANGGAGGPGGGVGFGSHHSSVITSTTAADTADPNWQANKSTVRERNAAMFNNDLMADIRFIVGSDEQVQTIPAHKYVLATGSSVFYAMFYGGLAENKQEIKVPDVEPGAFLTLLKYLYCDEIQLEADNVLATLYVAKKYIVPHLARACVNYLETSLTAKNACLLLSQSRLFEEPDLMQRCWEVIDAQVCRDSTITTTTTTTTTNTTPNSTISSSLSSRNRSNSSSASFRRPPDVNGTGVALVAAAFRGCSLAGSTSMPSSPTNNNGVAVESPGDSESSGSTTSAGLTAMSTSSSSSSGTVPHSFTVSHPCPGHGADDAAELAGKSPLL